MKKLSFLLIIFFAIGTYAAETDSNRKISTVFVKSPDEFKVITADGNQYGVKRTRVKTSMYNQIFTLTTLAMSGTSNYTCWIAYTGSGNSKEITHLSLYKR